MIKKTRVGVIGCGKMGAIHAQIYNDMPDVELIFVQDSRYEPVHSLSTKLDCNAALVEVNEISPYYAGQVDKISICTPASTHLAYALDAIDNGIIPIVEKPAVLSLDECDKLSEASDRFDTQVYIGHCELFNDAIDELVDIYDKCTLNSIDSMRHVAGQPRDPSVDVVYDLGVHDLAVFNYVHGLGALDDAWHAERGTIALMKSEGSNVHTSISVRYGCAGNSQAMREYVVRDKQGKQIASIDFSKDNKTINKMLRAFVDGDISIARCKLSRCMEVYEMCDKIVKMRDGQEKEPAKPAQTDGHAERKQTPVYSGFIKYFPLAMAEVAKCSRIANEQHNPGTPVHWDRAKSGDELDALARHLLDAGTFDDDGIRHSTKVAWRAMANLQKELEAEA